MIPLGVTSGFCNDGVMSQDEKDEAHVTPTNVR